MTALRPVLDVAALPDRSVDARAPIWWGNLGMVAIEGTMFALTAATYFYLRLQSPQWPPAGVELTDLPIPTGTLAVLLISLLPALWVDRAAVADDTRGMRRGLLVLVLLGLAALYLRTWEFIEQDVRWDANAYGSIVWTILGLHAFHLLAVTGETGFLLAVARSKDPIDELHRLDIRTTAVYWDFVIASWVGLYAILYLSPRLVGSVALP
jgi:cytochrome c oxidase subunit III